MKLTREEFCCRINNILDIISGITTPDYSSAVDAVLESDYQTDIAEEIGLIPLFQFGYKSSQIQAGVSVRATLLTMGDSTGFDLWGGIFQDMWKSHGFGGYTGKSITNVIDVMPSAGASISTQDVDYTNWPSSLYFTVPNTGVVTWNRSANFDSVIKCTATHLKVYYIKSVGAGTFKVQITNTSGSWVDVTGYTAVSANAAVGLGILTIPVPDSVREYAFRVVTTSGTVILCDLGVVNAKGLNLVGWNCGGTDLADAMSGTPSSIITDALADFAPDMMTHSTKDDLPGLTAALPVWQAYLDAENPNMDCIFTGTYGSFAEGNAALGTLAQNAVMRAHAASAGKGYYDYFKTYSEMDSLGFMTDNVHANAAFSRFLGRRFARDTRLMEDTPWDVNAELVNARESNAEEARSSVLEAASLSIGGNGATGLAATTGDAVSSAVVVLPGRAYNTPVVSFSGGAGSGATATATAVNGVITAINITAGGSGYNSPPVITISDADAVILPATTAAGLRHLSGLNKLTVPGGSSSPTFTLGAPGANGVNAKFIMAPSGGVALILVAPDGTTEVARFNEGQCLFATGNVAIGSVGASSYEVNLFAGGTRIFQFTPGTALMLDGQNFQFQGTAGSQIATGPTQKIAFWGATPIIQPAAIPDTTGAILLALEVEVNKLKALLRSLGAMAT